VNQAAGNRLVLLCPPVNLVWTRSLGTSCLPIAILYPIEKALAKRHLAEGAMVLYDLTSTYFEGRHCPLGQLGHPRDGNKGKLQVVFGLMTTAQGCPIAVEVYAGNTADPKTVADQVTKLRQRFGLQRVILVGDRGMITSARIRENLKPAPGIEWITALRAPAIKKLASAGVLATLAV
jgi:transposase